MLVPCFVGDIKVGSPFGLALNKRFKFFYSADNFQIISDLRAVIPKLGSQIIELLNILFGWLIDSDSDGCQASQKLAVLFSDGLLPSFLAFG